ncbi:MAG: FtsX-like permease family protein [Bacteroides sp.]
MTHLLLFKLIFRSWRRNKLFAAISLLSLTVGLACTTLLAAFVVHEYRIECGNPQAEQILRLTQEVPGMTAGKRGNFVYGADVERIVSPFPEIAQTLRMGETRTIGIRAAQQDFPGERMVTADSTLFAFFPIKTISGDLARTFATPDAIALSEEAAMTYFGTTQIGSRPLELVMADTVRTMNVTAVYRLPAQSMFRPALLAGLANPVQEASSCMVRLHPSTDLEAFRKRFADTELPTLLGPGHYGTQTLRESYFDLATEDSLQSVEHRQQVFLAIGLLSALLVLAIACFNYVNLSFSRLLAQVKMIRTETLMGAPAASIRHQLFLDTFLLVLIAFAMAVLLLSDVLPVFNAWVGAHLTMGFIFSSQVFPLVALVVCLLSVVPALYMSRKLPGLTESRYHRFFTGRKKRWLVSLLVGVQLFISLVLLMAFFLVRTQLDTVEEGGRAYQGVLELGDDRPLPILPFYNEAKTLPGIAEMLPVNSGLYGYWSVGVPVKSASGKESSVVMVNQYQETAAFLKLYGWRLLEPARTAALLARTAFPVLVNESFVRTFVPAGENPVGQAMKRYNPDESMAKGGFIVGVVADTKKRSLAAPVEPMFLLVQALPAADCCYLSLKIKPGKEKETRTALQTLWAKHYPDRPFAVTDLYAKYLSFNKDITRFSELLFVYSLITLFLTGFGLFGIARYATDQRKREIGIRKVNGASTKQILLLLNRPFVGYIIVAYLLAAPLTWWLMQRWLQSFAYRAEMDAAAFVLPLLITAGMTLLTVTLHSWRAATANPIEALEA